MQLHKRDVVAAAATILDDYGVADLTMRRLARELDITPGALYWHFDSKQQLLGAVADRLLQPVSTELAPAGMAAAVDWRRRVARVCGRMRDALLSHTDAAELVSASFAAGQSRAVSDILAVLADAAAEAGFGSKQAELAARTLIYYVLGATADEQSRLQLEAAGALPDGTAGSPLSVSADPAAGFAFGLQLLIDGLTVQSAAPVPDGMLDALVTVPPA